MDSELKEMKQFYVLWRRTNTAYENHAKSAGISYSELLILLSLSEEETPRSQKQICSEWAIPKQTVSAVLANFQKKGFVTFSPQKEDRRNKEIHFTPEGRAWAEPIVEKLRSKELYAWKQLGAQKRREFLEIMDLYVRLFSEDAERSSP